MGVKSIALLSFIIAAVSAVAVNFQTPLKNGGKHWAVLVAGSNTWMNYRHQADVCHAYQVMKDHGVAEENIIVLMYDDIAHNPENPTPGVVINRPDGTDVYHGVKIDYRQHDVTPEVFLAVLLGDKEKLAGKGTGRILDSGPNDHVFINFVDHGAPGLVAFPSSELHAREFNNALKTMYQSKKFAQMVIYIEACESGSMFKRLLPDNMNIFATTASNGKESSYATYFDKERQTYLGDLYSVMWMENSDTANLNKETLQHQFKVVRKETNMSHVQEYGDSKIGQEPVGDFQGNTPSARNVYYPKILMEPVPSPDVELFVLEKRLAEAIDKEKDGLQTMLNSERMYRDSISTQMMRIVSLAVNNDHLLLESAWSERTEEINFDCYEPAVRHYSASCRKLSSSSFALRVLYALQNLCNMESMTIDTITSAMDKICA